MADLIKSVSGMRGIFGEGLNPDIVLQTAAHFGLFCGKGKIIIGRDSRTTGPAMFNAVTAGLLGVGCDVVNLGIAATPTVLLAVEESDAVGGIAITASHNPAQWNAMKFIDSNGLFLFPEKATRFIDILKTKIEFCNWEQVGHIYTDPDAAQRHINKILSIPYLELELIRKNHFKVVLDSVNGAGKIISPLLLSELGCDVIEINSEPTGIFAHEPEPLKENLRQLSEAVKKHQADLGFATDPDVDRLAIVDENGIPIGEELSLQLAARFVLSRKKGDLVTNLSTSMAIDDIAREFKVQVHRTKVGEINVGKMMIEVNSPIGGEGNGGIICPEVHYTRDAPAGMALILSYLATTGQSISQLVQKLPKYYFTKDKITVEPELLDQIMLKANSLYREYTIDRTDGIKIVGDKFWIHIRKSGTEPIIRVYVESDDRIKSQQICKDVISRLQDLR